MRIVRKTISGIIEFESEEYEYRARLCDPDTDAWPSCVTDIDSADGQPIPDSVDYEAVEELAMENALLVDWYEDDGWEVEDSGGGCSALFKRTGSTICRITKANDPSVPQTMVEPIAVGKYSAQDDSLLQQECRVYQGGIQEMIGTSE